MYTKTADRMNALKIHKQPDSYRKNKGRLLGITRKGRKIYAKKWTPYKCSEARRICISCLKTVIHKNDSNYEKKICKTCDSLPGSRSLRLLRPASEEI